MSYKYEELKNQLFTDEGQRDFIKFYDAATKLTTIAGAATWQAIYSESGISGDSWFGLACFDRLIELGKFRETTPPDTMGQYRTVAKNL